MVMSQCPCWAIWANNFNNQIKADILRYNILLGNHVKSAIPHFTNFCWKSFKNTNGEL